MDDERYFIPGVVAAERLGISEKTLLKMIRKGGDAFVDLTGGDWSKPGRKTWGFTPEQFQAFLDARSFAFKPIVKAPPIVRAGHRNVTKFYPNL